MVVRNLALLGKEIERPVPVPGRRSGSCNLENGCLKLRADAHSSPSEVQALDVVIAQNLVFTGGWFHVLAFSSLPKAFRHFVKHGPLLWRLFNLRFCNGRLRCQWRC
jgi:hypothetical protein